MAVLNEISSIHENIDIATLLFEPICCRGSHDLSWALSRQIPWTEMHFGHYSHGCNAENEKPGESHLQWTEL